MVSDRDGFGPSLSRLAANPSDPTAPFQALRVALTWIQQTLPAIGDRAIAIRACDELFDALTATAGLDATVEALLLRAKPGKEVADLLVSGQRRLQVVQERVGQLRTELASLHDLNTRIATLEREQAALEEQETRLARLTSLQAAMPAIRKQRQQVETDLAALKRTEEIEPALETLAAQIDRLAQAIGDRAGQTIAAQIERSRQAVVAAMTRQREAAALRERVAADLAELAADDAALVTQQEHLNADLADATRRHAELAAEYQTAHSQLQLHLATDRAIAEILGTGGDRPAAAEMRTAIATIEQMLQGIDDGLRAALEKQQAQYTLERERRRPGV